MSDERGSRALIVFMLCVALLALLEVARAPDVVRTTRAERGEGGDAVLSFAHP